MPFSPKLRDIIRKIWILKIHLNINTKDFGYSYRNIGITCEICINLNSV